jgi:hypothetical protein
MNEYNYYIQVKVPNLKADRIWLSNQNGGYQFYFASKVGSFSAKKHKHVCIKSILPCLAVGKLELLAEKS